MAKQKRKISSWTEERRKSHGQKVSAAAAKKRALKAAATKVEDFAPPSFFARMMKFITG